MGLLKRHEFWGLVAGVAIALMFNNTIGSVLNPVLAPLKISYQ